MTPPPIHGKERKVKTNNLAYLQKLEEEDKKGREATNLGIENK